jgi:hypothetical protein
MTIVFIVLIVALAIVHGISILSYLADSRRIDKLVSRIQDLEIDSTVLVCSYPFGWDQVPVKDVLMAIVDGLDLDLTTKPARGIKVVVTVKDSAEKGENEAP